MQTTSSLSSRYTTITFKLTHSPIQLHRVVIARCKETFAMHWPFLLLFFCDVTSNMTTSHHLSINSVNPIRFTATLWWPFNCIHDISVLLAYNPYHPKGFSNTTSEWWWHLHDDQRQRLVVVGGLTWDLDASYCDHYDCFSLNVIIASSANFSNDYRKLTRHVTRSLVDSTIKGKFNFHGSRRWWSCKWPFLSRWKQG